MATSAPITKPEFLDKASPQKISVGDSLQFIANSKLFSTGSFGWHASGKGSVKLGETLVPVMVNVVVTVIGSKGKAAPKPAASPATSTETTDQ
jgi:hypothetical protein